MTDRESYLAALFTVPIIPADAAVVLCGEDAVPRLLSAVQMVLMRYAPLLVLTGGRDQHPTIQGAKTLHTSAVALGVKEEAIVLDNAAMNTREQAVNVVALAKERRWRRLLLVASPYHLPRAFLTFVQAVGDQPLRVIPAPAGPTPWWGAPAGITDIRLDLLRREFEKVDAYGSQGHVATYAAGLEYLKHWEAKGTNHLREAA